MTPRHAAALAYARAGIPIFPVRANGKQPLPYSNGFKDATTDENVINAWFAEDDFNLAVEPEQAGWCVVDLDGQEGIDEWERLSAEHGIANTYTIGTPSGGLHLYFGGSLPPSARKIGPGIDTRGRGSYVLVPPSVVDGVEYAIRADVEPTRLPDWIEERVSTAAERKTADGEFELDSEDRVREGRRRIALELRWNGPPLVGGGSDDRAYRLTARLRDIGLSDGTIIDMLEALWAPHFDRDWIETKIANAEKFAQNDRGSVHVASPSETYANLLRYASTENARSPGNAPYTVILDAPSAATLPETFARSFEAIRNAEYPSVEWVWQDRILEGLPNLYTGDAGAGKTTLAENLAVACACDVGEFLGAAVKRMPTLLLVGEDAEGQVRDNLAEIAKGLGCLDHPGMADIHVRSTLSHEPAAGPQLARIEHGEVEYLPFMQELAQFVCTIGRPMLIVIDPLAEFVQFDNVDIPSCGALGRQFCRLLTRFGAGGNTVLVNDHPSKSSIASGAHYAGSTQLKAAFALFATLLPGEWGGTLVRQRELTLSVMKARYAAESDVKFFRTARSPLFVMGGAPGETREDHMRRLYDHIVARLDAGLYTQRDERGKDMPPSEVAHALQMSPGDVVRAMRALIAKQWLVYKNKESGGDAYKPAHFARGPVTPLPDQGATAY